MENPWRELSRDAEDYALEQDRACLTQHNRCADDRTRFVLGSIPEPFIGNPESSAVVFLGKNPGHTPGEEQEYKRNHELRETMFQNLRHELTVYPFYPFDPKFRDTGAGKWWLSRTREIQSALGGNIEKMAQRMMVIEWFPYHSLSFRVPRVSPCPSQYYSFHLVREMLKKNVLVVGMRAKRLWLEEVDALGEIQFLKNPQCGHISRGNSERGLFEEIVSRLRNVS